MNRLTLFTLLLLFWVMLTWQLDPPGNVWIQDLAVGVAVAFLVTQLMGQPAGAGSVRWLQPRRYFWAAVYVIVLAAYVVMANLDVAYRVFHPRMPIRPGILKVKTRLREPAARTALGNSITLTPGTLTVDVRNDGVLMVHWINVQTLEERPATKKIIGRFEWFIEKIFE